MKDSEFIELLNLYLDHEISAADAARLEAEVQTNLARRRIYHQYCRMQKACKLVVADFQTDADAEVASANKKVVAFQPELSAAPERRQRIGGLYTMGTFAAVAACVAIIFVGRNQSEATNEPAAAPIAQSTVTMPTAEPRASATAAASQTPSVPRGLISVAQRPQPSLVLDRLLLMGNTQADAVLAAAVQQADNQLAWIDGVQLAPLEQRASANELYFAATLRSEGRPLGTPANAPVKQQQPTEEVVTWRFVK
jgi:hypothetical protein